ncbi:DNA-directed RNA polymerase subunit beta [Candidatus Peregrinibacteria bacterium CG22_combo_CG10-13_8_21_14_all_44_10]|nr:MAG: DNA-directed RNA polymerase subunit beta [Candidatus Peregrinibacteria bacterium CG2_30_44_17]PIP66040.1 MAG: DNA-directed RNA polymerase subunit beta [Candidatus Peregrinibacteria bacterium CG22_combo_CG10-13_8_21_14_all_44_10]PIS04109.1 MAG: DNA-directed RNA polymerase subunit beta [Candidatus Peregrinibacteria bacterium CG10_big_fil_rev_8_21_14_0_10_44_7]PJB88843.1 MAG: DNA-directed RNA polymerase subunit beta [Candidatus Peregrinibacteria bacterium CG_4_9_14_0_8_um_filter_44_15]
MRKFLHKNNYEYALPNLIEIQTDSYDWFLKEGIRELLDEVSPITDFSGKKLELHFLDHSVGEAKHDARTCRNKNLTYEAPLKVHVQLINKESGEIKEQDVFLGGVPLMTDKGTFIINGIERVVVSQIVRSPGVFFSKNGAVPRYHCAKIIPKRGAWLEIETDKKGVITVKIDRKRKIHITSLLRVFGYDTDEKILKLFKDVVQDPTEDYIFLTLQKDSAKTVDEAYKSIYRKIRPGDLATPENAKALIESMFFDYRKYDMGSVARYKLNRRFGLDTPNKKKFHTFQVEDLILILKHLIQLNNGEGAPDDIDHLSNRRIRPVGELVQNKFRVGLLRTDRIAKDRMTVMELDTITPTQLINSRPITAALREFYASSQLSQFMDQTNPLAELAHKRRLSAMGPGGLSRERASFDVRDVHASHYGRICPIATPEGPNIGLVVHLATYGRLNQYGFIETPFRKIARTCPNKAKDLEGRTAAGEIKTDKDKTIVKAGEKITAEKAKEIEKVKSLKEVPVRTYITEEVIYYDAEDEMDLVVAQANSLLNEKGEFIETRIAARSRNEATLAHIKDLTHIDISPKQIISVTTSLIPFLEHDDNTRASMGSNMQRQAVPLLKPQSPTVGTGMEKVAAESSGQVIVAERAGVVTEVDADHITVMYDNGKKKTYYLEVYARSNQATCFHQRAICDTGDKVKKGDVLVDGAATEDGELALGQNLLVAYMSWQGYNFEDAVILSERLVHNDRYSSVHVETFSIDIRDTKLGPEIVTRDIPNVGEAKLKDLDERGIVRIGAAVRDGDILAGKITPKGETELTAEERLLRAIFGDKARDVKDTSLRLPGGEGGKVVSVQIFDRTAGDELPTGVNQQIKVDVAQTRRVSVGDKVAGRHGNKGVISIIVPVEDMPHLPDGTPVDVILNPLGVSSRMNIGQILETHLGWAAGTLGFKIATPPLEGVTNEEITGLLKEAGLPESGKIQLYDGRTGEPFDHETTVGTAYIMKLNHLIEDKIHARSVGPYSLVTQQPLGGKAQHGGQRFGEMEVWALEAYGAAHTLQEMLTIKSDDVYGRAKAYESIVKGELIKKPRTPESFNVLVKELQSLGLNVDLMQTENTDEPEEEEYTPEDVEESEETIGIIGDDIDDADIKNLAADDDLVDEDLPELDEEMIEEETE